MIIEALEQLINQYSDHLKKEGMAKADIEDLSVIKKARAAMKAAYRHPSAWKVNEIKLPGLLYDHKNKFVSFHLEENISRHVSLTLDKDDNFPTGRVRLILEPMD